MSLSTAKVISHTQPVDGYITTAQELIAYVARVSNPSNQSNNATADRLINYLIRHKHWSPFEHYSITLEIECPKDISIQLLRHKSFCFQEFSGRYASYDDLNNLFLEKEVRLQDTKNRQNSLHTDDAELLELWEDAQQDVIAISYSYYQKALKSGIAKEVARSLLPIGLLKTRMYVTGNIRSFIHYLLVRLDPTTQKEHRQLAKAMYDAIKPYFDLDIIPELKELYDAN